jgi:hypothetical protein
MDGLIPFLEIESGLILAMYPQYRLHLNLSLIISMTISFSESSDSAFLSAVPTIVCLSDPEIPFL